MRKLILIFIFLNALAVLIADQSVIDSLEAVLLTAQDIQRVDIYNQLTKASINTSIEKAEFCNQEALRLAQEIDYQSGFLKAIYYQAKLKNYHGELTAALEIMQKALKLSHELQDDKMTAEITNDIGMIYYSTGNFTRAIAMVEQAKELFYILDDQQNLGKIENNLGLCQWRMGNFDLALSHFFTSLELVSTKNHNTLNNISIIYGMMGDFEQSLAYQEEALAIRQEFGLKEGILDSYNNFGLIYRNMREPYKALEYLKKSVTIAHQIHKDNAACKALNNIGSIYDSDLNVPDSALYYYQKSLLLSIEGQETYNVLNTRLNIGNLKAKLGDIRQGRREIEDVLAEAQAIKARELVMNCYLALAHISGFSNQFQSAYDFFQKYTAIKDSIYNDNIQTQIADLQVKYDLEKAANEKKEISLMLLKSQTKNMRMLLGIIGLIIVLSALYIILRIKLSTNRALSAEIAERKKLEQELELRVKQRTIELDEKNQELKIEIDEHKKTVMELNLYRNSLEHQVEERTLELRIANNNLEDSNSALQKKNDELNELNRLFVGREFRIKELRDQIKKIQGEEIP
ncbi:MAG: tetratricopeptide repeat protein [Candidatus Cloacimonetes bacterium]|nr:tetratricopeptide repeat protein [Candidatus Cloacimonadota bacterium]